MTNKIIIIGVIVILVTGLVFLGSEVQKLRGEVAQLTQPLAPSVAFQKQQLRPKFRQPDDWWVSFNNPWDPYSDLDRIQRQMNQLFNQRFQSGIRPTGVLRHNSYGLSTDIKDAHDKYVINMDIPGMEKENINVEVKNNILLVSGERHNNNAEKNNNYYKQERSFGYFSQSLPLPEDANSAGISVKYDKGVLSIEIPKLATASAQPKESTKIKVN